MFAVLFTNDQGKVEINLAETIEGAAIIKKYADYGDTVVAIPVVQNEEYVWVFDSKGTV